MSDLDRIAEKVALLHEHHAGIRNGLAVIIESRDPDALIETVETLDALAGALLDIIIARAVDDALKTKEDNDGN